jgi:hypothetical protein
MWLLRCHVSLANIPDESNFLFGSTDCREKRNVYSFLIILSCLSRPKLNTVEVNIKSKILNYFVKWCRMKSNKLYNMSFFYFNLNIFARLRNKFGWISNYKKNLLSLICTITTSTSATALELWLNLKINQGTFRTKISEKLTPIMRQLSLNSIFVFVCIDGIL